MLAIDLRQERKKSMFEGLFQPMHLLVVLFIALLVFGPKKLPELGKGLGDGIKSFKDSMREREQHSEAAAEPPKGAPVGDTTTNVETGGES
jgi:sec-independent protein translocase protein TatA